jgi:hypothetical protein
MHRGVPHTALVRSAGFGWPWSKPNYPQVTLGATDKASNGAVSFVASKVLGEDDYPTFDQTLFDAVMEYQREKGLYVDGVVGKDTYRAMGYEMPSARAYKKPFLSQGWVLPTGIVLAAVAIGAGIVFWPRREEYKSRAKKSYRALRGQE